ncbi:MAG: hypothetical protein M1833_007370 [Piccolia ochrophora]|nr:MAG: hypothetical protein M1833_007370 [Piccolia ochrophora]
MRLIPSLYLLYWLLFLPAQCKRGGSIGGGSSSDDDSSSSGGDSGGSSDSSSSSGGSSSSENRCTGNRGRQQEDIYSRIGSYYNGTLRVSHRVEQSPTPACINNNTSPKWYEYNAVLYVGPKHESRDPNQVFWSLRAFRPKNSEPMRNCLFKCNDPEKALHELIRIQSTDSGFRNESWTVAWNSKLSPTNITAEPTGEDENNFVNGWNLTASYVEKSPLMSGLTLRPDSVEGEQTIRTSNFVTLSEICTAGYTFDPIQDYQTSPTSPFDVGLMDFSVTTGNLYFDLGANISMSGIGSDSLTFALLGGRITEGILRAIGVSSCKDYSPQDPYRNLYGFRKPGSTASGPGELLNISAEFDLDFEGKLTEEKSDYLVDSTEKGGPHWKWKDKSSASAFNPSSGVVIFIGSLAVLLTL